MVCPVEFNADYLAEQINRNVYDILTTTFLKPKKKSLCAFILLKTAISKQVVLQKHKPLNSEFAKDDGFLHK